MPQFKPPVNIAIGGSSSMQADSKRPLLHWRSPLRCARLMRFRWLFGEGSYGVVLVAVRGRNM